MHRRLSLFFRNQRKKHLHSRRISALLSTGEVSVRSLLLGLNCSQVALCSSPAVRDVRRPGDEVLIAAERRGWGF